MSIDLTRMPKLGFGLMRLPEQDGKIDLEQVCRVADAYLDAGCSIESCARALNVHPNTVRYRLRKIADATGRDPSNPRDAYVLRVAATVGRLTRNGEESPSSTT